MFLGVDPCRNGMHNPYYGAAVRYFLRTGFGLKV
jgi:hypothetical protein